MSLRACLSGLALLLFGVSHASAECVLTAPASAKAGTFFDVTWQNGGSPGAIKRMDGTVVANTTGATGSASIWATNVLGDHTLTMTAGAEQCSATADFVFTPAAGIEGYDIVVVAGQSNAEGYGLGPHDALNDALLGRSVYQLGRIGYSDKKVVPVGYWQNGKYSDGLQSWDKPENDNTLGFALSFAQSYVGQTLASHRKVLIVPAAHGSTSILQWLGEASQPSNVIGTTLYADMIERVNAALALPGDNRVVAFLWQQGEADITKALQNNPAMNASIYQADETELFSRVRSDLPGDYPVLIGQPVPTWIPEDPTKLAFQTAMANAAIADGNAKVIGTANLLSDADIGVPGGPVHFNADSQMKLGGRYFSKFYPRPHHHSAYSAAQ